MYSALLLFIVWHIDWTLFARERNSFADESFVLAKDRQKCCAYHKQIVNIKKPLKYLYKLHHLNSGREAINS